ncbi:LysE family translocator [Shewanella sp. NIFS-20-20]|uniref:LysE family translocator n=1 Tax=Shewanella sp. NIFS-20-20 TaxID=2853806 RepID=UPI001C44F8EE|nr:LysE family translocator [Shewanella sp. NIFS-20-20]MBV7317217.1 LysE family translocator [Shewanella sp. NIFS-20-20]
MDLPLLITLALVHSIALVSPGPDFAIIIKTASQQTRAAAIACAFGIATAILVHTILSLTGVSVVIARSELAYLSVQVLGACYLAWIGIGALRGAYGSWQRPSVPESAQTSAGDQPHNSLVPMTRRQGFFIGLYTNLLNPKALIFFITLFSALMTPEINIATKTAAAIILFSLSILWFVSLAVLLSKANIQARLQRISPYIDLTTGIVFVVVAASILWQLTLAQTFA